MDKQKQTGTKENCYFGLQVSAPRILFTLCFYLSIEAYFSRFFSDVFIYVCLLIKSLQGDNTAANMVLKLFFVISLFPSCVPSYHPRLTSSWSNVAQS